jgi:quercetin dioxygenase-like cupin family protein
MMPIINLNELEVFERLPGWRGRFFHSAHMTFAHYDFDQGARIHEHHHGEEEVYQVLEGQVEITIAGRTHIAEPGLAAIVPADTLHSVVALTSGRLMIVDFPAIPTLAQMSALGGKQT